MSEKFTEKLRDDSVVCVRPITRNDVERERAFVEGLSPEAKHFRFLGGIGHLTEEQLLRFCDIDRQHEMAFVALVQSDAGDIQVGVARFVADPETREAEIAITVADKWKGKGLGRILLEHLINYARRFGVKRLYSIELAANIDMQNLMREFRFSTQRDPDDATQLICSLDLLSAA